jgi:hypothetical protein
MLKNNEELVIKNKEKGLFLEKIRNLADTIGIDTLGFAKAGTFTYYTLSHSRGRDPKLSLPDAKKIIVAGIYLGGLTVPAWRNPWYGRTSRSYLSAFFLDVVKPLNTDIPFKLDLVYSFNP